MVIQFSGGTRYNLSYFYTWQLSLDRFAVGVTTNVTALCNEQSLPEASAQ